MGGSDLVTLTFKGARQNVSLAPLHVLARVPPLRAGERCGLDALPVDAACAGVFMAARFSPQRRALRMHCSETLRSAFDTTSCNLSHVVTICLANISIQMRQR